MAIYPIVPMVSHVSAPARIDPAITFEADAGYVQRRPLWSRGRRRYEMTYMGLTTTELHDLRDFCWTQRVSGLPFEWVHPRQQADPVTRDTANVFATTPVILGFHHGMQTGEWLAIYSSPVNPGLVGVWQVTRLNATQVSLTGSTAGGVGGVQVCMYIPTAVIVTSQDTMESPEKLVGPETVNETTASSYGRWNMVVTIVEQF